MLHADDRDLARRDEVLTGLGLILDERRLCTELDALMPGGVENLALTSVRYKPGMSCVVGIDLTIDGAGTRASAQLFGPDQRDKFVKHRALALRPDRRGAGMLVLAEAPIVVWLWPGDEELAALSALGDPARRHRLVASCLGDSLEAETFELRTLRYKPQRRWTARVDVLGQTHAVLKVCAPGRFARAHNAARLAHAFPTLHAPRVIGSSARRGAMALAWVSGEPLDRRIAARTARSTDLHLTGESLARLHRLPYDQSWSLAACTVTTRLEAACRAIAALAPRLEPVSRQVARWVSNDLLGLPHQIVHGDCSADQVLVGDAGVSLIDWDRMALGPGVVDLGRFAGTLTMADLVAGTDKAEQLMAPVMEAYCAASQSDPRPHMPAALALAFLDLACEPFRRRAVGWSDLLARAVRTASDLCGAPIHHA